jgi:hypothetical protein
VTIVMGLDLSLTSPGIAFIQDGGIFHVGNIKSKGKAMATVKRPEGATLRDRHLRLESIEDWVFEHVNEFVHTFDGITEGPRGESSCDIDLAVIEGPAMGSTNGSMHDRSGLWWGIVHGLQRLGIETVEVSPAARCKYITGHGRKDKTVVLAHAIERYQDNLTEHTEGQRIGKCDDIADAIGLADMGARRLGCPVVPDDLMPLENLAAMDGVLWKTT